MPPLIHQKNTDQDPIHDKKMAIQSRLPAEILHFTETFPFSPVYIPKDQIRSLIESRLPTYERATALAEAYLQHISLFFRPVDREQLMEELIPMFYRNREQASDENETGTVVHRLSLLTAVFACGSMGDLTLETTNEEGELFRQLSRAALSLQSIFEGTSLATVQAVALLGLYEFFSCSSRTLESAWKMQALSFSLASSVCLHRNLSFLVLLIVSVYRLDCVSFLLSVPTDLIKKLRLGPIQLGNRYEVCQSP